MDFIARIEGSLVILIPMSELGRDWIDESLPHDTPLWGSAANPGVVIEARYFEDIFRGIENDGLEIIA